MKKFTLCNLLLLSFASATYAQTPFTKGNLVVYRMGDGSTTLTNKAVAVFLDEYKTDGTLVQSVPMPKLSSEVSGNNKRLTAGGSATSEGMITRSQDKRFLVVTGYDLDTGVAAPTGGTNTRVLGLVNTDKVINTVTTFSGFSTGNLRGAAAVDSSGFWFVTSDVGVGFVPMGGTSAIRINDTPYNNIRAANIYNNQLYISTNSGSTARIAAVGTGLPTTGGQPTTPLPGLPTSGGAPYQFYFDTLSATQQVLYIAHDGNSLTTGIQKYSLVNNTWISNGNVNLPGTTAGERGIVGFVNGNTIDLYVSTAASLYKITDNSGFNSTMTGTPSVIATSQTGTAFRGLTYTPEKPIVNNVDKVVQTASIGIYPNPASHEVFVQHPAFSGNVKISVRSLDGKLMIQQFVAPATQRTNIVIADLAAGVYLLDLTGTDFTERTLFVKQ